MSDEVDELEDTRAPLLDHLIELRRRLIYCIVALIVTFGCAATSAGWMMWALRPRRQ